MSADRSPPLAAFLESLAIRYASRALLPSDPLVVVHEYDDPRDQEVAAFVAAGVAYGRASIAIQSARRALERMGPRPGRFVTTFEPRTQARVFDGWVHRVNRGIDLAALSLALRQIYATYDSLGALFVDGYDAQSAPHVGPGLERFVGRVLSLDFRPIYSAEALPSKARLRWFLPSPADGSACKRLNLFLRWMVRRDEVDLGLWPAVERRHLVMPVDTHVARIAGYLGLTSRATVGWKMALEITGALRAVDPDDPVRFDWALSRLGILDHCPRARCVTTCRGCPLFPVCTA